jgi:hypothetical protein
VSGEEEKVEKSAGRGKGTRQGSISSQQRRTTRVGMAVEIKLERANKRKNQQTNTPPIVAFYSTAYHSYNMQSCVEQRQR